MKQIIVLKGKGNTGKTTTIRKALSQLFNIEFYKPKTDVVFSFRYKGKTIAIISAGDVESRIIRYFKEIEKNFDILICACHTKGATWDFYNKLDGEKYKLYPIDKKNNTDKEEAETILEIKKIINSLPNSF